MTVLQYALFLVAISLATYTQAVTGFAFSLVLLGLVGVLNLAPLPMAVNVATSLTLVNAVVMLWRFPPTMGAQVIKPTLTTSLIGVCLGLWLLSWLSNSAIDLLKLLLGATIVACAFILVLQKRPHAKLSGKHAFNFYGALSGIMSGLFSAGGPPLVFHFYRQPAPAAVIRNTLVLMFATAATFRLILVVATGSYDLATLKLAALSFPAVFLVSWLARRFPPTCSPMLIKRLVFLLLLFAGVALAGPSLMAVLR